MFFDVSTFRYHAQFAAKSSRGKNAKGRKITSMLSMPIPSSGGERLLVTSNDSRMRLYHIAEKAVEMKYAGHENTSLVSLYSSCVCSEGGVADCCFLGRG